MDSKVCIQLPENVPPGQYIFKSDVIRNKDFSWSLDGQSLQNQQDYLLSVTKINYQIGAVIIAVLLLIAFKVNQKINRG